MTSTETYTAAAGKARENTEKTVEAWKQGTQKVVDQASSLSYLPSLDLVTPVERYFEYVQRSIDLNRDLATRWAELVTNMSGAVKTQAEQVTGIVKDQTEKVASVATDQAKKAEELAKKQADEAEQIQKEQVRQAKAAERAEARAAHAKAREQYEDLTKAELADQLSERGLPKSGTVDELIERLVSADSE